MPDKIKTKKNIKRKITVEKKKSIDQKQIERKDQVRNITLTPEQRQQRFAVIKQMLKERLKSNKGTVAKTHSIGFKKLRTRIEGQKTVRAKSIEDSVFKAVHEYRFETQRFDKKYQPYFKKLCREGWADKVPLSDQQIPECFAFIKRELKNHIPTDAGVEQFDQYVQSAIVSYVEHLAKFDKYKWSNLSANDLIKANSSFSLKNNGGFAAFEKAKSRLGRLIYNQIPFVAKQLKNKNISQLSSRYQGIKQALSKKLKQLAENGKKVRTKDKYQQHKQLLARFKMAYKRVSANEQLRQNITKRLNALNNAKLRNRFLNQLKLVPISQTLDDLAGEQDKLIRLGKNLKLETKKAVEIQKKKVKLQQKMANNKAIRKSMNPREKQLESYLNKVKGWMKWPYVGPVIATVAGAVFGFIGIRPKVARMFGMPKSFTKWLTKAKSLRGLMGKWGGKMTLFFGNLVDKVIPQKWRSVRNKPVMKVISSKYKGTEDYRFWRLTNKKNVSVAQTLKSLKGKGVSPSLLASFKATYEAAKRGSKVDSNPNKVPAYQLLQLVAAKKVLWQNKTVTKPISKANKKTKTTKKKK